MSWLGRLTALAFLVVLFLGIGAVAREVGGDLQVVETVTTNADGTTTTVREGGRNFPGYLFLPFAFFGAIFFWFLAFGLLKAVLFGFWSRGRWGRNDGSGGWSGRRGERRERWEQRAREVHDEWHASEGRGDSTGPGAPAGA